MGRTSPEKRSRTRWRSSRLLVRRPTWLHRAKSPPRSCERDMTCISTFSCLVRERSSCRLRGGCVHTLLARFFVSLLTANSEEKRKQARLPLIATDKNSDGDHK